LKELVNLFYPRNQYFLKKFSYFSEIRKKECIFSQFFHKIKSRKSLESRRKPTVKRRKRMKATGIVRRIDELGRVVIPKEIRRTLRIKEGDPLEIFTDRDELMLKKYSPIATLERFSGATARSLHDLSGRLSLITDTDEVLFAYGDGKRELDGKHLSEEMDKVLRERRSYTANAVEGGKILDKDYKGE
jgi:AbrB family looped-hinge helix DNA binding protein